MLYNISIADKNFEKGHSQIGVDSIHSSIERKLKYRKFIYKLFFESNWRIKIQTNTLLI